MFTSKTFPLHKLHPLAKKVASQSYFMWQTMACMLIPPCGRGNILNFGCMVYDKPSHEIKLIPKGTIVHGLLESPNIISKKLIFLTTLVFETMSKTTSQNYTSFNSSS